MTATLRSFPSWTLDTFVLVGLRPGFARGRDFRSPDRGLKRDGVPLIGLHLKSQITCRHLRLHVIVVWRDHAALEVRTQDRMVEAALRKPERRRWTRRNSVGLLEVRNLARRIKRPRDGQVTCTLVPTTSWYRLWAAPQAEPFGASQRSSATLRAAPPRGKKECSGGICAAIRL